MRILHAVEFYEPSVGGAQEVVRQISTRLAAQGHDVTVATSIDERRSTAEINGVKIREFAVSGNAVRGMKGDVEGYQQYLRDEQFDVVMTYAAQQWTTDAMLPVLDDIRGVRVLAPCGFSGLAKPAYREYFAHLAGLLSSFDALITHSATYQDASFIENAGITFNVIPNGADEREFGGEYERGRFRASLGIPSEAPMLVLVGSHTGRKGHSAAIQAFLKASSMHDAHLVIIGNSPTSVSCRPLCTAHASLGGLLRRDRQVHLSNPPREMVIAALRDADLMLVCSQIECSPVVLFEAAAAGLPFITVDVGNAVEIIEWTGGGVLADSTRTKKGIVRANTSSVADAIDVLWSDGALRSRLGESGTRAWKSQFTWAGIADEYANLYKRLVT
jgi:glycosyltransferase involved in cell wall biosynthesis